MLGGIFDVCVCGMCVCVCVCRTWVILFNSSTDAITDHCQSAKDVDTYFKSQIYVEDIGLPSMDGIRTYNLLIDNLYLITMTPPLLANLIALNFRQWNQCEFSTFEDHFQLSTFPNPTCLYNILGLQQYKSEIVTLKEHEEIMK